MSKILSFDVGTTAMKCILFDDALKELFYSNREYSINTTADGRAELDPEVYFETFLECVKDAKEALGGLSDVSAVTFTTQGETLIPVDKRGAPLCPAIVWLDTRASSEAEQIKQKVSPEAMYRATGLCDVDGALPAAKILWLKANEPEIYSKAHKFLLLEDFLIYKLTGRFVSEKSLQSSTGWYDIVNERLFDDVAEICGVLEEKLPEILPCGTVVGRINQELCSALGFSHEAVVVTAAMDQISSAVGAGNIKEGVFTETTGTALVVGVTAEKPVFDIKNPITVYKHYDGRFMYMPYFPTAGIALKWFKDTVMPYAKTEGEKLGLSAYGYIDREAERSPVGSGGVIMLPQLSEYGAFLGLSLATEARDMARATLEGIGFMLRTIVEKVEQRGIKIERIYSLGGGSYSSLWCKIKSDICGKEIEAVDYAQTTALGAAILGFVAIGSYSSVSEAHLSRSGGGRAFVPNGENREAYNLAYKKYKNYLNITEGEK